MHMYTHTQIFSITKPYIPLQKLDMCMTMYMIGSIIALVSLLSQKKPQYWRNLNKIFLPQSEIIHCLYVARELISFLPLFFTIESALLDSQGKLEVLELCGNSEYP